MRVSVKTLGCKVNQAESDLILAALEEAGVTIVDFGDVADCYIINSCAVTEEAERKTRQYIRRAVRQNPQGFVLLVGCYAKLWGDGKDASFQDRLMVLPEAKEEAIRQFFAIRFGIRLPIPSSPRPLRARAWVKVEEGCDHFCSFCIVPYLRGGVRSRRFGDILKEVHHLIEQGIREVVLCGINLGYFGKDTREGTLIDLVEFLVAHTENVRFRLSSLEPYLLSEDFATRYFALGKRVCPHLHLPLQSGSDRILKRMQRGYTTQTYADLVAMVRSLCPEVAITTDVIVGFPGETEADFEATVRFSQEMKFSRMHVFAFSPRPGTPAADWEKTEGVPGPEKHRRVEYLLGVGKMLSEQYHKSFLGKVLSVLIESVEEDRGLGYSENYIPFRVKGVGKDSIRDVIPVLVEKAESTCAEGRAFFS